MPVKTSATCIINRLAAETADTREARQSDRRAVMTAAASAATREARLQWRWDQMRVITFILYRRYRAGIRRERGQTKCIAKEIDDS